DALPIFQSRADQKSADAAAAMGRNDKNIGEIGERRPIRDGASKTDLPAFGKGAETKRIANAFFDNGSRNIASPIGGAEKVVDQINVQASNVGGDFVTCWHKVVPAL